MPSPALLLIIATLLPLVSFALLVFWGKRLGNPLAGYVGTAAITGSFVCSVIAMMFWLYAAADSSLAWGAGKGPIEIALAWIPTGQAQMPAGQSSTLAGYMDLGIYVDSLTMIMFVMITLVAAAVHMFSMAYMREDARFSRFYAYLGLFCFSMLGLVIGGTILQLFVFWELVGLCSYLLIGFWYEKKSASNAAMKAFLANRVGDFGFLIGFGVLFYHLGNASLPALYSMLGSAGAGGAITLPDGTIFGATALTVMGIGLFCGAVGKSAQFPLHVWLPDAMEGPTPVSALIHAATMVAAGVYLVGRIFPILTPDAKLVVATIGLITLTIGALIALAQSDIKKVLAYSTISQLGYMMLAMGIGSWMGGLFHLITHAFFKALLFLGSGSVIHAAHHEQELPQYGGLWRRIPWTAATFLVGVLAISGLGFGPFGLSGFFSKDTILLNAAMFAEQNHHNKLYWIFFIVPVCIAYVTAFYMMRCWTLTFAGKPRNRHLHEHARENPVLWIPLVVLAILAAGGGYIGIQSMLRNSIHETKAYALRDDHAFAGFETAFQDRLPGEAMEGVEALPESAAAGSEHGEVSALAHAHHLVVKFVTPAFIVGIGLAFLIYRRGYKYTDAMMRFAPLRYVHRFLYRKMYFDELYNWLFVGSTLLLSRVCGLFDTYVIDALVNSVGRATHLLAWISGLHDKFVIDGAVTGSGKLAWAIGGIGRGAQTGRIRGYMTLMILVFAAGLVVAMAFYLA